METQLIQSGHGQRALTQNSTNEVISNTMPAPNESRF